MADVIGADLRLLLLADNWQFLLNPAYRRTYMLAFWPFPVLRGATALDPPPSPCILPHALVSHLVLGWPVAVGGECRPIGLLSGAVLLYAATVKLPRRTAYLISAHASYAETPRVI